MAESYFETSTTRARKSGRPAFHSGRTSGPTPSRPGAAGRGPAGIARRVAWNTPREARAPWRAAGEVARAQHARVGAHTRGFVIDTFATAAAPRRAYRARAHHRSTDAGTRRRRRVIFGHRGAWRRRLRRRAGAKDERSATAEPQHASDHVGSTREGLVGMGRSSPCESARQHEAIRAGASLGPLRPVLHLRRTGTLDAKPVGPNRLSRRPRTVSQLRAVHVSRRDRQRQAVSSDESRFHFGHAIRTPGGGSSFQNERAGLGPSYARRVARCGSSIPCSSASRRARKRR